MVLISGMLLSVLAGYYVFWTGGVPSRAVASHIDRYIRDRITVGNDINKRYSTLSCSAEPLVSRSAHQGCSMYGPVTVPETIVVWGDSHAEMWSSVFYRIAQKRGARVILFSRLGNSCQS